MHLLLYSILLCLLCIPTGCQSHRDNNHPIGDTLRYSLLACGLYRDQMGDIYFKSIEQDESLRLYDRYIGRVRSDYFEPDNNNYPTRCLGDVVDTSTFRKIGSAYYADTNHIYFHFNRADGGSIFITEEAQIPTFRMLTEYYAVDSHYVYYRGDVVNEADVRTFTAPIVVRGDTAVAWIGRDKNHYFNGEDTVSENDVVEGGIEFNSR
jgi:hypothetical protein